MRVVLWIGNEPNQKALANKINDCFPLSGIITESRKGNTKKSFSTILEKIVEKLALPSISAAWWSMKAYYDKQFPSYPATSILDVENINSEAAYEFSKSLNPDLIIVSGTRLVKEKMLGLNPGIGILNLHTGLSPYIKGGPNCTNWCIATKQFHLIGNTIMWIDAGIDSGNILTTEFTELDGTENLTEIHIKVMEHAHNLYLKAIKHVANGITSGVKQSSIASGKTYYSKDWTLSMKIKLVQNLTLLKKAIETGQLTEERKSIQTINLVA
jgi:methionyl-tRNA formyltransferase